MELIVVSWFLLALGVGILASSRGRNAVVFFCLAALLSPLIGLVVVLVLPNLRAEAARQKERAQEHELQIESIKAIARAPSAATATPSGSIADELVKLAALRDSGVLTDAEFATQKARLMG